MKKLIYVILVMLIAIVGLSSCRGGSAKKAVDIVKKYSGKAFESSEKSALMLRLSDDVVRHINLQKYYVLNVEEMEKLGVEHAMFVLGLDMYTKFNLNNSL